ELAHCVGHRRKRGRADIGALREAEEHGHGLAAKIFQRAPLSVVVGEFKMLAVIGSGDVGIAKWRGLLPATCKQNNNRKEEEQTAERKKHFRIADSDRPATQQRA